MKTVKKKVLIFLRYHPIDHESQQPFVETQVYSRPYDSGRSDYQERVLEVELDIPVRLVELPTEAVRDVTAEHQSPA